MLNHIVAPPGPGHPQHSVIAPGAAAGALVGMVLFALILLLVLPGRESA